MKKEITMKVTVDVACNDLSDDELFELIAGNIPSYIPSSIQCNIENTDYLIVESVEMGSDDE